MQREFAFQFDRRFRLALTAGAITPATTWVRVDDEHLTARFGVFRLSTPRSNVIRAEPTGPHRPIKAIGIRTSLTDRGLTFGTSALRMACIRFREPVRVSPVDVFSHPGLSVSVADVDGLVSLLNRA